MITPEIGTIHDVREKARRALTDYLTMFLPGSWTEPLARLKLLLQSDSDVDWEALKGHALILFDEKRLSNDRVECLARVERLSDAFRDVHKTLSPADWHKAVDDIVYAANFRVSKASLQTTRLQIMDEKSGKEPKKAQK
ncbi:MAG: hypothetical protein AM324_010585 [Candidatus Thorarchaeota archaeon SMTZ1-83]